MITLWMSLRYLSIYLSIFWGFVSVASSASPKLPISQLIDGEFWLQTLEIRFRGQRLCSGRKSDLHIRLSLRDTPLRSKVADNTPLLDEAPGCSLASSRHSLLAGCMATSHWWRESRKSLHAPEGKWCSSCERLLMTVLVEEEQVPAAGQQPRPSGIPAKRSARCG